MDDERASRLITVSGRGVAYAKPDRARILITVESLHPEMNLAHDVVAERSRALLATLREAGTTEDEMHADRFSIWPHYEYQNRRNVFRGYLGRQRISVELDDIERVGRIVRAAVQQDVEAVPDVRFWVSDREAALGEAREAAVGDARRKAEHLASLTNCQLGEVQRIDEGQLEGGRTMLRYAMSDAAAPASEPELPVDPESQRISVDLRISWLLVVGDERQ